MSDGPDCDHADDIPQSNDGALCRPPEMEVFTNTEAPNDDTAPVHSVQYEYSDRLPPFATPKQLQLCHSIVDSNLDKTKLNHILKQRISVPKANAKIRTS